MAVKKTQMYRRQLDGTETDLNPLTESQYVLMENGQTVQEILSDRDSDKYTPVITNSSSTFKVGQGDNVDLSSSMKEGAYDSCVLKGKTMVNCIQEPSSKDVVLPYGFTDGRYVTINDTKESGALSVELKGQTLVNLATKTWAMGSTAQFNKDTTTLTTDTDKTWFSTTLKTVGMKAGGTYLLYTDSITYDTSLSSSPNLVSLVSLYEMKPNRNVGKFISNGAVKVTIPSDVDASDIGIRIHTTLEEGTGGVGKTTTVKGLMILEYQEGMENWDIPYFEGMTSCKMPILHTVGKNLFDKNNYNEISGSRFYSSIVGEEKVATEVGDLNHRWVRLKLPVGKTYAVELDKRKTHPSGWTNAVVESDVDEIKVGATYRTIAHSINSTTNVSQHIFTTTKPYVFIHVGYGAEYTQYKQELLDSVMLNVGSSVLTYEPHKSSILSLPEEVVLRSLPNGTCDTLNLNTGVYTQRIGEKLYDGSQDEGWFLYAHNIKDQTLENAICYQIGVADMFIQWGNKKGICCDKLQYDNNSFGDMIESTYWGLATNVISRTNGRLVVCVNKANAETEQDFRNWLSQNPVTVQYQLATPIVRKLTLPSTLKSWNTTTHIYSEIPENALYPILSHSNPTYPVILKPSTKYSIVANSYSNSHTNSAINFNLGGATATTTVGNRVTAITTPSTLSNELLTMSGRGNKLNNVMVIEGDVVGDEPYFEGICDCKSPILSNCGKNLFDEQRHSNPDNFFVYSSYWSIPIQLKGNTEYKFSYTFNNVLDKQVVMRFATCPWTDTAHSTHPYSLGQVFNKNITSNLMGRTESMLFTTPADGLVYLHYYNTELTNSPSSFNLASWYTYILKDIHLEESSTSTQYEPYKSNTTTFEQKDDKTIVLRSLPDGTCDTLNVETGEYVQRIGETFLSPEKANTLGYSDDGNISYLYIGTQHNAELFPNRKQGQILCDKLPYTLSYGSLAPVFSISQNGAVILFVFTSEFNSSDNRQRKIDFVKSFLQRVGGITILYPLANPIVSTIDVQGFPYAYTNGHVQLSSGSIEQSLTPTVEYSLSANKTGQINSNTKRVSAHQKQLDDFEAMMLTSMVQSAYDKAILQFDYEMQMMSLGGE